MFRSRAVSRVCVCVCCLRLHGMYLLTVHNFGATWIIGEADASALVSFIRFGALLKPREIPHYE